MFFYSVIYNFLGKLPGFVPFAVFMAFMSVFAFVPFFRSDSKRYKNACAAAHVTAVILSAPQAENILFVIAVNVAVNFIFSLTGKIHKRKKTDGVEEFTREFFNGKKDEPSFEPEVFPQKKDEPSFKAEERFPQKKVLCYTEDVSRGEDEYKLTDENISLNHAIGVALQLKKARLSVGDRLETDSIYKTLSLYRAKNSLSGEEMEILNGYLSVLLKLMAKYSL